MQKQLADGLILRTLSEGHAGDRAQLPEFYALVNGEFDPPEVAIGVALWTEDLMNDHPQTSLEDIFVVVDPAKNDLIVSATLLIPQRWRYEEIPIEVGRPELVGTLHEYRQRGLVRALFEAVHERSAMLGHQLQAITGIAYFYRKFGYTMAVELGSESAFPISILDEPEPNYSPAFWLRPAVAEDIPDIATWHDYMARERLLSEERSLAAWRHEIVGHNPKSDRARSYLIIVNAESESVGYVEMANLRQDQNVIYCVAYVVGDQSSYLATFDDVMLGIKRWAASQYGECPTLISFAPGGHSALNTLVARKVGGFMRSFRYRWYLRVPDPIAFLRQIQPMLERRLEGSGAHRYTGELNIGFYDSTGIALSFEAGRIVEIAPKRGTEGYDVSFPWHLFWNVVFGDQSVDDLRTILPDVLSGGKAVVLLNTLFPKKKSWIEGLA